LRFGDMDTVDCIDRFAHIYGTVWTQYHHIYGVEHPFYFFGSDGCEFESRRGRLYLAVYLL
jgi:hypothetical protein